MALQQDGTVDQLLSTWALEGGPTDEEVIEFADAASKQLQDDDAVATFTENVKQVGTWANEIDASFDRVTRGFADMVKKYQKDFPAIKDYNNEWISYNKSWVAHLALSRDVASETVAILKRFDQVFLDMVENIVTEQDRLDCIVELQAFIDEDHDKSQEMAQGFLSLKRNIEDFVGRLDQFIKDTGADLAAEARRLRVEIQGLRKEIEDLDKKIKRALTALFVAGGCLSILGVIITVSIIAVSKKQRQEKFRELLSKRDELAEVNRKQEALAHLQSDFDSLKPDIALICENLVLFAEIWSSVRTQALRFRDHIEGGMEQLTNLRFKKELRLARDICAPLQAGLQKYATELENRQ